MKRIPLFVLLVLMGAGASAQTDFSGTWNLKQREHVTGPEYRNDMSKTLIISQAKDSLYITEITFGAGDTEDTNRIVFPMNGKPYINHGKTSKRKFERSISWSADKKALTTKFAIYVAGSETELELTRVETWTINDDGDLHVNKKSIETKSESWEVNGTFGKDE